MMQSEKLEKKITKILKKDPHLSRNEAIALLQKQSDIKWDKLRKLNQEVKKEKLKAKGKSVRLQKSVHTISGGKVSPR